MKLFCEYHLGGGRLELTSSPSDTVRSLKEAISPQDNIPAGNIRLFKDMQLTIELNDLHTIEHYAVDDGCVLYRQNRFLVVRGLLEDTFGMNESQSIGGLKRKIFEEHAVPIALQRLTISNQPELPLTDATLLDDLGLYNNDATFSYVALNVVGMSELLKTIMAHKLYGLHLVQSLCEVVTHTGANTTCNVTIRGRIGLHAKDKMAVVKQVAQQLQGSHIRPAYTIAPSFGDKAPAISLEDPAGESIQLGAWIGQVVVCVVWGTYTQSDNISIHPLTPSVPVYLPRLQDVSVARQNQWAGRVRFTAVNVDETSAQAFRYAPTVTRNITHLWGGKRFQDAFQIDPTVPYAVILDATGAIVVVDELVHVDIESWIDSLLKIRHVAEELPRTPYEERRWTNLTFEERKTVTELMKRQLQRPELARLSFKSVCSSKFGYQGTIKKSRDDFCCIRGDLVDDLSSSSNQNTEFGILEKLLKTSVSDSLFQLRTETQRFQERRPFYLLQKKDSGVFWQNLPPNAFQQMLSFV
eukprot:GILK01009251.1.p1 GENE.GILK01009251.1~~GILK01009251.1.p1  ORF type:complete len:525 (-),score=82.48 GILK01009251.1:59-1633(-)